jgi:hypothetical protein
MIGVTNRVTTTWSARADQAWLSIEPDHGDTPRNFAAVLAMAEAAVSVDTTGLPEGSYKATVTIEMEGVEAGQVPVRLHVTGAEPGQRIGADVGRGEGTAWESGIRLSETNTVSVGTWRREFHEGPIREELACEEGDLVILVEGTLVNENENDWQVEYWAEGFDSSGALVATGLDTYGALNPGRMMATIRKQASMEFALRLSWAGDIERITINANSYEPVAALPQP